MLGKRGVSHAVMNEEAFLDWYLQVGGRLLTFL